MDFKLFAELADEIGVVTLIILWIVFQWVSNIKLRDMLALINRPTAKHVPDIVSSVSVCRQVNLALDALIDDLECDRAYVYEYHNGGTSCSGIPFSKFSKTHERVKVGITPFIRAMQNLPIGVLAAFHIEVASRGHYYRGDVETIREGGDASTYMMLRDHGVKSVYAVGIWNMGGQPLGFVGIDFCREKRDLADDRLGALKMLAAKICGLLLAGAGSEGGEAAA